MKGSQHNPTRDLKNGGSATSSTTTPVVYRNSAAVYRSLAAVPAQLDFDRSVQSTRGIEKQTGLLGPQSKNHGEVIWAETKKAQQEAKEAHPIPIPLIVANAPHNSLFLESNPVSKVITAVHNLFEQHQVDSQYNSAKFKWKCACYAENTETRFVCRLFSVPDRANYFILDFQRRSGDAFHFQSIYKAINFKLLKSGFVVPCADSKTAIEPVMRTFKPLALPVDFYADEQKVENDGKEMYEPLCRMCLSQYIDVQREGLLAVANQLEKSDSARRCLADFGEKLVEAVSLSRDIQVRRLATSALASLSVEVVSHRFIKEKGGLLTLIKVLLDENELIETRRQAGRVLQNIKDWDPEISSIIKRANIASDARLIQLVRDLQARAM